MKKFKTALLCVLATTGAIAQQAPANPSFPIKGFDITGDNPLPEGDVSRVLAPYLRADATLETLQKATAALEAALKERGFILHRVALPPQEIGNKADGRDAVTLNIVKFVIGKVSIEGAKYYTEANLRASLPELAEGTAPNFRTLAVQTAIANESQGKQVQVALKESEEADKIDARIIVREAKPWNFSVSLANTGSATTGNDRLTFAGSHSNLFERDHQLTAAYTTSIERPSDVQQIGLNYRIPLYKAGGVLGLSYTQSDVTGDNGSFKNNGAGRTFGINYNHYLPPVGGYRSYLGVSLEDKQFDIPLINGQPAPGQQNRSSRPLTFSYNVRNESDTSVWGYELGAAFNLSGGVGNDVAAYKTEDPRIDHANWTAIRGSANYSAALPALVPGTAGWLYSVRTQFQYSPDALISGEQFGLGGATSVRGTTERPISGDSGVLVTLEITTKELIPGLRALGFVDAGWLSNNATSVNKPLMNDSLASVGLGLRYAQPGYTLSADYGRIVTGSSQPNPAGTNIFPQAGQDRIHLSLALRF